MEEGEWKNEEGESGGGIRKQRKRRIRKKRRGKEGCKK